MTNDNQLSLSDQFEVHKVKTLIPKMSREQLETYVVSLLTFHLSYRSMVVKLLKDKMGGLDDFKRPTD